jgi:hypothetical protein
MASHDASPAAVITGADLLGRSGVQVFSKARFEKP